MVLSNQNVVNCDWLNEYTQIISGTVGLKDLSHQFTDFLAKVYAGKEKNCVVLPSATNPTFLLIFLKISEITAGKAPNCLD